MLRKVAIIGLLVMMALVHAQAAPPETPRLRPLTVRDGLPSNIVWALAADRSGHLWIGTEDGLARYDGVDFRIWRMEEGLPANEVWGLHVDAHDRLWIATSDGLAMLDRERAAFRTYTTAGIPEMESGRIWSVTGTRDGAIWFGTETAGLYRLGPDGGVRRFVAEPGNPRSLPSGTVAALTTTPDGTLWVGTHGGVARWTGDDFERIHDFPADPHLLRLVAVDDSQVWVGQEQGLSLVGADGTVTRTLPWDMGETPGKVTQLLLRDSRGIDWVSTWHGLALAVEGRLQLVRTYSDLHQGHVPAQWTATYEDREGGLWLGSANAGLWYLAPNWRQFSVLQGDPDDPASLGNFNGLAIAPGSDGAMWLVGDTGVLDRLGSDSSAVEHVYHAGKGEDYVPTAVLEDDAGNVWLGFHGGLARYDPAGGEMRAWQAGDAEDPPPAGDCLVLVQAGDLVWSVSALDGLQARGRDGSVRERVRPGDGRGLEKGRSVWDAGRGPDGALWVLGESGLLMWNSGTRALEPVPGAPAEPIDRFALEGHARVWTVRDGVLESWQWDGVRLTPGMRVDHADGMPLLTFHGLVVDAEGIIWLTSSRGLVRVDPALRRVDMFGVSHGLPGQDIVTAPVARPSDGRLHFSTGAALVIFDPARVRPVDGAPGMAIRAIEVRGRDGARQLDPGGPLRLGPRDHEIRVRARLAGFNGASHNRYRFKLQGYDPDWVETDASGERVFPALAPGSYRLDVMGRTPLSPWSEPTTLEFEVAAPWWRTSWAVAGYMLAGLLLGAWILGTVRARIHRRMAWQRVQDERELARQASEAKTRFLATLGHEVRTPMTGVLGMSELLLQTRLDARQRGFTESIRRAGDHLMRLVDDALDLARIEAGKLELDPRPFDPRALLAEVSALMAPLAERRGLEFRVQVTGTPPPGLCGDEVRIRQILLNLLGNAIKFTERGSVRLEMQALAPTGIRLVVADTGPGLNAEQQARLFRRFEQAEGARTASRYGGSGLGLAICQELAAEMGGTITVESAPGRGTRFAVELPLRQADPPSRPQPEEMPPGDPAPDVPHPVPARILLVEDDPTVAEVIIGLLASQGCHATHASHGLAALAEVQRGDFDLALLDLDLPGIDGIALARQLRAQGWQRPLVAVTARADAAVEPLAREAGFDAFLRKPVGGATLARTIGAVLGRQGALPLSAGRDRRLVTDGPDVEMAVGGVVCTGDADGGGGDGGARVG